MKNYADFYAKLTSYFRKYPVAARLLQVINSLLTKVMYLVYPILLGYLFFTTPQKLIGFILIPGISFVLVSLVRKWLNVPRPYEAWAIHPLIRKDTKGQSLPSRHVFSATIISMAVLQVNSFLGIIFLLLSLVLACCRVIGGVHYPRDVIVGCIVGVACGLLLIFI